MIINSFKFRKLAFCLFVFLLILNLFCIVSAADNENKISLAGKFGSSIKNFSDTIFIKLFRVDTETGIAFITGSRGNWGGIGDFLKMLAIGLLAGVLGYLGTVVVSKIQERMAKKLMGTPIVASTWLDFIAGGASNVIIFALVFAILMQVTFLNQIIKTLIFWWFTPWWLKPVMLAIIFAYLPAIVESIFRYLTYRKATRAVMKVKVGMTNIRGSGSY